MNEIIMLDGLEYVICDELYLDNKHYIYAMSMDDNKYTLLTEQLNNNISTVKSVTDQNEVLRVLDLMNKGNN